MSSALDEACKKVDDLILEVGKSMGDSVPKLRVDPDDPWVEIWNPPKAVYKERCEATGYLMTKPFERNNPMPGQFNETCDNDDDCPADLNGDGEVGGADLTIILSNWGCVDQGCEGDLTGDDLIDGADLTVVLSNWGLCSPPGG